jgi:anaerobic ribonucleoside-triphosphate reductase activating protein
MTDTAALADRLARRDNGIDGVSISGGEPFQQPEALLDLLIRLDASGLSRLIFSGYTIAEIQRLPLGPEILAHVDVVVAGRYVESRPHGHGLVGSSNQRLHFLTARHTPTEFLTIPRAEAILHADGSVTLTGIAPLRPQR